jgi:arylsulfatase A-like enzyme
MVRHPVFGFGVLGIVAILLLVSGVAIAEDSLPNIIIVMPDDVGYGDMACLGSPIVRTPSLDQFWSQSVRLTNFHVSPTCSPTRSALITGRHEFKNGVTHTIFERERLTLSATTLAQYLKRAGYTTGIFGKWHLGDEDDYLPEKRGFDEVYIHGSGGIGQTFPGSCGDAPGNTNINPALWANGKFEKTTGYCTDLFFDRAAKWIDGRRGQDKPFFAYITPNAAHDPHVLPDEEWQYYKDKVPEEQARFYGMIENIDRNFGQLMKRLDEWEIADNTLVIFLTDNGGTAGVKTFNAGMRGAKVTPYEGGTRVPSWWRWPKHLHGGIDSNALTAHLDVFPTIAQLVGQPLSPQEQEQIEGRSVLPLLKGAKIAWPNRYLVTHVGRWERGKIEESKFQHCAIRDERFALVNNTELFDLSTDPGQQTNVVDAFPEDLARLRTEYDQWWKAVQPGLVNEKARGPKINPFKERFWKQFGGEPDEALRKRMDPEFSPYYRE